MNTTREKPRLTYTEYQALKSKGRACRSEETGEFYWLTLDPETGATVLKPIEVTGYKNCCQVAAYFGQVCKDCNKPARKKTPAGPRIKNLCAKMRSVTDPYEVWEANGWVWKVLKKWQADDRKPYARWFCQVSSPIVPDGELGDCYAADIINHAVRTK